MNCSKLIATVAAVLAFGSSGVSHSAVSMKLVAGSTCAGASSTTFTPAGPDVTATLCVTTTTELFCGATFSLQEASATGVFNLVAPRTRGASFDTDGNASYTFPIAVQTPAAAIDLGASVFPELAAGTYPVATLTFRPLATATANSYTIDLASASTATGTNCATEVNTGNGLTATPLTLTKLLPPTNVTFTRSPATLTFAEGGAAQTIAVSCTGTIGTPTPVTLGVAGTNNAAFTVSPASLSFADCSAPQNVTVTPRAADAGFNAQQTGNVNITNTTVGGTVTAPPATAVTVNDNQTPAVYTVTKTSATVTEGNAATDTLTVTCAGAFTGGATSGSVAYAVTGVTNPGDISAPALTGTLSFSACAGQTQSITISPRTNDTTPQGNKSGTFTISAPVAGSLGATTTGSLSVVDDDAPQTVTVASSGSPAEQGTVPGTFTLTRSGGSAGQQAATLTVNLTLAGTATFGTSCAAGVDYQLAVVGPATASLTAAPRTVTFPASATTAAITLTPCDDLIIDTAETAILTIAAPTVTTDYTVGSPATATLTIADDDSPQVVTVAGPGGPIAEAAGTGTFTFTRTGGSAAAQGQPLTVNIGRSGTATFGAACTAGVDYMASVAGTTLMFTSGSTATITVTACQDTLVDPAETIIYSVAPPTVTTDYTVGSPASATGTIADDEVGVSVSGNGATEGSPVSFVLTCTGPAASTATVTFAISGQDAGAVITPAPGPVTVTCGTPTTVTVSTTNDAIQGNARSVGITLTNPVAPAVLVGAGTASASVLDNDAPLVVPTMSVLGLGFMSLMLAGFVAFQRRRVQK